MHIPPTLRQLRPEVDEMARKQQAIPGRYGQRVAHEGSRVQRQSTGHGPGYSTFHRS